MNGDRLKKRRKELNLSAEAVAKLLNTTRVTISRWESGVSEPNDKNKIALAKVLKTSVSYLVGETDMAEAEKTSDTPDKEHTVVIQTNDPSLEISSKPSNLRFQSGDVSITLPNTPENKKWFDEFLSRLLLSNGGQIAVSVK